MSRISRRRFLATAASVAAVTGAASPVVGRALDASDVIRVGVVGLRGRGQLHNYHLEQTRATLGPWLDMAPLQERFIDNPAANELVSRPYREPFVLPAIG